MHVFRQLFLRKLTRKTKVLSLFVAIFSFSCHLSHGLGVQFPNSSFYPEQGVVKRNLFVSNEENKTIALELTMVTRRYDLSGRETYEDADDDFLVYPNQILLGPGGEEIVTIQWMGEAPKDKELAYRVVVSQIPFDFSEKSEKKTKGAQGQVKLIYKILRACYVVPNGAKPKIVVDSAKSATSKSGETALEVVILNEGSEHLILRNFSLEIMPKNRRSSVSPVVIQPRELEGINYLAGLKRKFMLTWPKGVPVGDIDAFLRVPQ